MVFRIFGAAFVVTAALLAGLALAGSAGTASADPNEQASCVGFEFSAISPPGSSEEFPGGAPELVQEVATIAEGLGAPPGAVYSFAARLHEGSHAACDEALE